MFRAINGDQVGSMVRSILIFLGTGVVAKGYMSGEMWLQVVSGLTTAAVALWGFWANNDKNLIKSAAQVPAVKTIVAPPVVANNIPSEKVVS